MEPSYIPDVIDEETAPENIKDISDFAEDESTEISSDATDVKDLDDTTDVKDLGDTSDVTDLKDLDDTSDLKDLDDTSDVVTVDEEFSETVEEIGNVTDMEPSYIPDVIDEETAPENIKDISDFAEDESTEI